MPESDHGFPPLDFAHIPLSEGEQPGRVVLDGNGYVRVLFPSGSAQAHVPGRLRGTTSRPITGDFVVLDAKATRVLRVVPRKTFIARTAAGGLSSAQILAANVDIAFLVTSLDSDFSPRRLERYLATVRDGGAVPVVLLTKAAEADDPDRYVREAKEAAPGISVHAIDVLGGMNGDIPAGYLQSGLTGVLIGSSGVGKSTLLNHLLGRSVARTGPVRDADDKGRHTTSHRELFALPSGGFLIDTPGVRELALHVDPKVLGDVFDDVGTIAASCRFRDCRHVDEPGCAVIEAVRVGALAPARLSSFHALRSEAEAQVERGVEHQRRARERKGSKIVREAVRGKRGK